jgi:hypothetical protein
MKFQAVVILAEASRERIILKSSHLLIVRIKEGGKHEKGRIGSKGLMLGPVN